MVKGELVCVDSCVFLTIILEEPAWYEKCVNYLDSMKERKASVCVTSIIVQEIMKKIWKEASERNDEKEYTRADTASVYKRKEISRFLTIFGKLMEGVGLIFPKTIKFNFTYERCNKELHLGEPNDILNISLAIDNQCSGFATLEDNIYNEKRTLKKMTNDFLKIHYIKKI